MIVDAFILGYKRPHNLARVVAGVRRQRCVRDIYVFHNHPSVERIGGVINVVSDRNFGCVARHALALLPRCDVTLFVDDDVSLTADLSPHIAAVAQTGRFAVGGVFSRVLLSSQPGPDIYKESQKRHFNDCYRCVDIITGRVSFCLQALLPCLFRDSLYQTYPLSDDIVLNLSLQMATGFPSMAIPAKREHIEELPQDDAVHHRPEHWSERSAVVNAFIQRGWRTLVGGAEAEKVASVLNAASQTRT
jgi:hypothetical protein